MPVYFKKKRHKYRAEPKICMMGHKHPSMLEANHCERLYRILHEPNSPLKKIEYQRRFNLIVNDKIITFHKVDFTLEYNDGCKEVQEVKGFATRAWGITHKLFMALYPEYKYTVIKK